MHQNPKKWDAIKINVPFQQIILFDRIKIFPHVSDFLYTHRLGETMILSKEGNYETISLCGETVDEEGIWFVLSGCDAG
jgi:hypothetical protein